MTIATTDILPDRDSVLVNQGIPKDAQLDDRIEVILAKAMVLFAESAEPKGVVTSLTIDEFASIYEGRGLNAPESPVAEIFPKATCLGIFVATVGPLVGAKIDGLFEVADFALAAMLDSVASAAADRAAAALEYLFLRRSVETGATADDSAALRYSPGYCGWHISGQEKLFAYLHPEEIGVTLRPSFLMEPLKSVSGVVIVGPKGIHEFVDSYDFCGECRDHACQYRNPVTLHD